MSDLWVLWDIDGTLLQPFPRDDLFREAVRLASFAFGLASTDSWEPDSNGRTDAAVLRDGLRLAGSGTVDERWLLVAVRELGLAQLARSDRIARESPVADGARASLDVSSIGAYRVRHTVLTGNTFMRATAKLRATELLRAMHLSVGGFGDLESDRAELAGSTISTLTAAVGMTGPRPEFVVVGDTAHDVSAAVRNSVDAIGVSPDPKTRDELSAAGAIATIASLTEFESALGLVAGRLHSAP